MISPIAIYITSISNGLYEILFIDNNIFSYYVTLRRKCIHVICET